MHFQNGETSLHAASLFGHLPVVKQLIAAGSDIKLPNQDGFTATQIARQQRYHSVFEYLKERERELNLKTSSVCKVNIR